MKRTAKTTNRNAAVLYARVSTEEQASEGCSLAMQEGKLRAYAILRGLDVVDVIIEDGVSGGTSLEVREGGQRIVELVKRGSVAHVVTLKLDRLFRDCADCLTTTKVWDQKGIALHLIDMGGTAFDTSSAMGRFFITMMGAAAELEKNMIRERTSQALQYKKSQGELVGAVPFGKSLDTDGVHVIDNAAEQACIRAAKAYRASGLSLRAVAACLAQDGYLSRTGKPFEAHAINNMVRGEAA